MENPNFELSCNFNTFQLSEKMYGDVKDLKLVEVLFLRYEAKSTVSFMPLLSCLIKSMADCFQERQCVSRLCHGIQ